MSTQIQKVILNSKPVLNVDFIDLWYRKVNLSQKYILSAFNTKYLLDFLKDFFIHLFKSKAIYIVNKFKFQALW